MDFNQHRLNNYTDSMRNGVHYEINPVLDDHKARYLMEIDRAKDGLELVIEVDTLTQHNKQMNLRIQDIERDNIHLNKVIAAYVEKFGKWEKVSASFGDSEIKMPEPNEFRICKRLFKNDSYPYEVKPGNKINAIIEVREDAYKLISKKVTPIKPKITKVACCLCKKNAEGSMFAVRDGGVCDKCLVPKKKKSGKKK